MTVTRVQANRFATAGGRPTGRPPGEIYTNWPDNQLGVVDAAGVAVDLLAIRNFSTLAAYVVGNYVVRSGQLYQAIAPTGPGAFVPASWSAVTSASVPSLPWFDTRALAAAAVIPAGPQALMTAGYTTAGDGGGELYYRVGGTTTGGFQSADGAWWALEGASKTRFWSDVDNGAALLVPRVLKQRERVFVGAAVDGTNIALNGNPSYGWLTNLTGPNFYTRDSSIGVVAEYGNYAISGASRGSDSTIGNTVGVAGYAKGDGAHGHWGGLFEVTREHASAGAQGIEIDVRNCIASVVPSTPYNPGSGPHGILLIACGPNASGVYGPAALADSGSAIVVALNTAGGNNNFRYSRGIVFLATSLAGVNGTDGEAGNTAAISLARSHTIQWYATGGAAKASIVSKLDSGDTSWDMYWFGSSTIFSRNGGLENAFHIVAAPSAVNFIKVLSSIAGSPAKIQTSGADANVDLQFLPQGAGAVSFGTHAAKAAEAFSGYITIKDAAGNPRKLMVCA